MARDTVPPPELTPDDVVRFVERHTPPMESGDYKLALRQRFRAGPNDAEVVSTATLEFEVRGDRFTVADADVHAVFPPDGATGKFSEALPHIAFSRSTLPWERQCRSDIDVRDTDAPWLALLVLDEAEQDRVLTHVVALAELSAGAPPPKAHSGDPKPYGYPAVMPQLPPEQAQHATDQVRVLDVPWSLLRGVLPRGDDLRATAHVRMAHGPHGSAATTTDGGQLGPELAMVVANRLPPPSGTCTVHLVSIEHRYHVPGVVPNATPPRDAIVDSAPRKPVQISGPAAEAVADGRARPHADGEVVVVTVGEDALTTLQVGDNPREADGTPIRDAIGTALDRAAITGLLDELLSHDSDLQKDYATTGRSRFTTVLAGPGGAPLGRVEVAVRRSKRRVANTPAARAAEEARPRGPKVAVPKVTTVRFRLLPDEPVFDAGGATGDTRVRLVALRTWSFICEREREGFVDGLKALNNGGKDGATFHVPVDELPAPAADDDPVARGRDRLRTGAVAVPHFLRGGGRTVSFYRGPFISDITAEVAVALPVGGPDELLVLDPVLGMWNTGLAVAWELGRLLSLEDREHATRLLRWKRRHARSLAHARQAIDRDELPLHPDAPDAVLPPELAAWFRALTLLHDVPFNHLVPDERMLPRESLRWFDVDDAWVAALRDGAFSVGRVLAKDHVDDASRSAQLPEAARLSGVLIRSRMVRDWPRMVVDGWTRVRSDNGHLGRDAVPDGDRLRLERMDRLGPHVLLCLFADPARARGRLEVVDLHLPAEVLHHGVDVDKGKLVKELRSPEDGERIAAPPIQIPIRQDGTRVIDLATLTDRVEQRLRPLLRRRATTADLALQLLDTPPMVRFRRILGASHG